MLATKQALYLHLYSHVRLLSHILLTILIQRISSERGSLVLFIINMVLTCKIYMDYVSQRAQQFLFKNWRPLTYRHSLLFNSETPQSGYSCLSHMDLKCMKFPAVLFSNYSHWCLPLNWPRLSQHALLVSVSHNCCLQLLSKRGRDSATQLQGNCHSHAPLAVVSPVDEEKCIHYWDAAATDI